MGFLGRDGNCKLIANGICGTGPKTVPYSKLISYNEPLRIMLAPARP